MKDARGLDVSADSGDETAAVDHFVDQMLSLGPEPHRILGAAARHPGTGLLQVYAAVFHLYATTETDDAAARGFLDRARGARTLNARERDWLSVLEAWLAGDYEATMDACEALTRRWPRDLLAAKVAEFHYYVTGQHWQAPRFLAHMERIAPENRDSSHLISMHAFALELSGRYEEAEAMAQRAIALERVTPWAHHCLAHAFIRRGRIEAGERVLRDLAPTWPLCGQAIHGHNAWHLALFTLARLDFDETLKIHGTHVSGLLPDSVGEQVDAISLLWRIELAGREITDQWDEIATHLEPRTEECFIPFISAHVVYALGRAGRTAALEHQLAACRKRRDRSSGERRRMWDEVGLPLVDACAALAVGDVVRGATTLEPVIDQVGRVGGSDAQDDLFRQAYLASLIQAGRPASARSFLGRLLDGRAPTPLEAQWAASCGA